MNTNQLVERITSEVINELKKRQIDRNSEYHFGVPVGISNRHVHLSKEDLEKLFGVNYSLTPVKELSQPGQFACQETLTIIVGDKKIDHVRILGPTRSKSQVEVSQTDARHLKVDLDIRNSGDLEGTHPVILKSTTGEVNLKNGLILATRHIHLSTIDAASFGLNHGDCVSIKINSSKPGVIHDVRCKVSNNYRLELHLDTDDGNAFLLNSGDYVELIK